jgi:hypothetical protein
MSLSLGETEQQARALLGAGRLEEAEAMVRPWLASGSGPIPLWRILSAAIKPQGKLDEVRLIQEMLVQNFPGDLPGRFDLSETLLLQGDFTRGWREYRWRYSLPHTARIERKVQRPRWEGEALPGRTLLIHDEQGYGDTFQFLRLLPETKRRSGARVVLEINHETVDLARRSPLGVDEYLTRGTLPPAFDIHCEMMSLPQALGLQLADLPGPLPYLLPDPARVEKWRARLAHLPRPIVALAWAGRPTHFNDTNRSMTLADLAPLGMPGVSFITVQKGPATEQVKTAPPGMALTYTSDEIADFDDTAAIFMVADLLISVDSSPIHLCGALGRPAWVMLPFMPDWRWLMHRPDTPWYTGHRLFRQPSRGDWPAVVNAIAAALAALRDGR